MYMYVRVYDYMFFVCEIFVFSLFLDSCTLVRL